MGLCQKLLSACVFYLALTPSALASSTDDAVSALKAQMSAWNNQDLDGSLSYYWDSDQMTWVNRKGVTFGFAGFAKAMRSDLPDKSRMGNYDGKVLYSTEISPESVLIVLNWQILGPDGKRMMGGISTQLWRKTSSGWKAVFEHAS
jgi:ketosteroid isomerase-like protein